jgi:hypothetical protein
MLRGRARISSVRVSRGGSTPARVLVVSNSVDLEIMPADEGWSTAELRRISADLGSPDSATRTNALSDLRFMASEGAVVEAIRLLGDYDFALKGGLTAVLTAFPDHTFVVEQMERSLASPEYPVTRAFLEALARLTIPGHDPADFEGGRWNEARMALFAAYWAGWPQAESAPLWERGATRSSGSRAS